MKFSVSVTYKQKGRTYHRSVAVDTLCWNGAVQDAVQKVKEMGSTDVEVWAVKRSKEAA